MKYETTLASSISGPFSSLGSSIMVENPILVDTHGTIGSHKALEIQMQDATSKILSTEGVELVSTNTVIADDASSGGKASGPETLDAEKDIEAGKTLVHRVTNEAAFQANQDINAALPDHTKDQPHIVFIDPIGTRWTFPYADAKTWDGAKKLIKSVFVEIYIPDWLAADIDEDTKGPTSNFSIIQTKPGSSRVLTSHWENLVSPGWEFKIEFNTETDVLPSIRKEKEEREAKDKTANETADGTAKEPTPIKELSKIVYVANYLIPDEDGDYRMRTTERKEDKIQLSGTAEGRVRESVLEEHREVYYSDRLARLNDEGVVDTIGNPVLYVRSPILLDALRANVDLQVIPDDFYPMEYSGRSFSSDLSQGRFVLPFTDLYHNREKLLQYREIVGETHDKSYSDICVEHINILNDYLEGLIEVNLKESERLASGQVPKTTFNALWLLLKPGSDVYVREEGKLNVYVIESYTGGPHWYSTLKRPTPYDIYVWNLNFDGNHLSRSVKKISIPVFDRDRDITSLPLFPVRFHVDEDPQTPLRQALVERGKRFVETVRKPSFQEYTGPSRLQGIRTFNEARVVIDHASQPWDFDDLGDDKYAKNPIQPMLAHELGEYSRILRCSCQSCEVKYAGLSHVERRPFDDYDNIDLRSKKTLTEHQYLLCWSHVFGFVLKDRAWDILEVSGLKDPKIDKDIIDSLVLKPESNKMMIKAVCEIFGGTNPHAFSPDFVRGKGEGQILLLHGPPGTGKTLTAESVAEYTGRPLLSITAADLGHEPEPLERNLLRFFRNARKWNAIVLLDEADVYLETRSSQDLRRNSIVSIFLRALDYFQGILFLTTNRVGSFDEAFMSRIHVQIGYDPLDDESRKKIWDGYFKKLSKNHETDGQLIHCSYDAKEYVRREEDLRVLKWNGREIRNAFQTAVALACFQAKHEGDRVPELTDEHLRQVVEMSHNFKSYLKAVRGPDEEMAWAARIRNDETKTSQGKISNQKVSI